MSLSRRPWIHIHLINDKTDFWVDPVAQMVAGMKQSFFFQHFGTLRFLYLLFLSIVYGIRIHVIIGLDGT